jgi:short-subunit dehydrogenase
MSYILILGASSDIAKAIAHKYAANSYNLLLAGRNTTEIEKDAANLHIRYDIMVKSIYFDALDFDSHYNFYEKLNPKPIGVICVFGYMPDHNKAITDFNLAKTIIDTNYTGCVSILNIIANDFEQRKNGFIAGISSCAGDRGRGSNYLYGSAKGAFSLYLSGLRNRLSKSNVHVLTVKPGFVATRMTASLDLPKLLTAQPHEVASDIYKAQQKKEDIIYTKWFWWGIMHIIKHIPEKLFKKLNL